MGKSFHIIGENVSLLGDIELTQEEFRNPRTTKNTFNIMDIYPLKLCILTLAVLVVV